MTTQRSRARGATRTASRNPHAHSPDAVRGVSLIEAMVACVVFSLGVLGAGLLVSVSGKSTNDTFLRTQAGLVAESVVERMHANPLGVRGGAYLGTYVPPVPAAVSCATGCTAAQLAAYDRRELTALIASYLPDGAVQVECDGPAVAPATEIGLAPYAGSCLVRVSWRESAEADGDGTPTEAFELAFQP